MNLVEAARSGKRFKRKGVNGWFGPITEEMRRDNDYQRVERADLGLLGISVGGFFANDWEVEEEKLELSREDLAKALSKMPFGPWEYETFFKELGFKP